MTKPFGFAIHVAVDGYSRKVLWLIVLRLINSPNDIAALYLSCVEELPGAKIKIITDLGTENTLAAAIHSFFRQDTDAHHLYHHPEFLVVLLWQMLCWMTERIVQVYGLNRNSKF